jgi:hypothetical protein
VYTCLYFCPSFFPLLGHRWVFENKDYELIAKAIVKEANDFKRCNLIPLLGFDATSHTNPAKMGERVSRDESRAAAMRQVEDVEWDTMTEEEQLLHLPDRERLTSKSTSITPDLVHAVIRAVRRAKISHAVSPAEADHQLVHVQWSGLAKHVWTLDGDIVSQGVPVIRNLNVVSKVVTVYKLPASKLDWWQGVNSVCAFAFFSGCDYNRGGVKNMRVGATKALAMLRGVDNHESAWSIVAKAFQLHPSECLKAHGHDDDMMTGEDTCLHNAMTEMVHHLCVVVEGFTEGLVCCPTEKRFQTLSGDLTVGDRPQDKAQRMSLGICCGDIACTCRAGDCNFHKIGPITSMLIEGDVAPVHLSHGMVKGSWIDDDALFCPNGEPWPKISVLKRWLQCRGFPMSLTLADGTNALAKHAGLLQRVRDVREMEITRALTGDDVVKLECPEGMCLHDHLVQQDADSAATPAFTTSDRALGSAAVVARGSPSTGED